MHPQGVPGAAPRPEPRGAVAPRPEPGLDLSLSPRTSPGPSPEPPCMGILRPRGGGGGGKRRQVRFLLDPRPSRDASAEPGPEPGSPAAPELHSSLGLQLQLQRAAAQEADDEFDALRAAEEQLRTSFLTRCGLDGSLAEGLNVPRSRCLFRDLVSLQVPEEAVLSEALRERLALLPPRPETRQVEASAAPDLLALCDPLTLAAESPLLSLAGLPAPRLQRPRPRPPAATFLMYQALRRWDA